MNLINEAAQWGVLVVFLVILWNFARKNPAKLAKEIENGREVLDDAVARARSFADRAEVAARDAADKVRDAINK